MADHENIVASKDSFGLIDEEYILERLEKTCEMACKAELDRYQSLSSLSERVMSCVSILLVAVITGFGLAMSTNPALSAIWPEVVLVVAMLLACLTFAVLSQLRFKYDLITPPLEDLKDYFSKPGDHECEDANNTIRTYNEATRFYVNGMSDYHKGLAKRNEKMLFFLRCSLLTLCVGIALIALTFIAVICLPGFLVTIAG